MAAREDLEFTVLEDFTPGIYDDWMGAGQSRSGAPLGSAQKSGTSNCLPTQGGGLMPGPRVVNTILQAPIDASGYPTSEGKKMYVCAMRVMSPVYNRVGFATLEAGRALPFPDNLFFGFEWYNGADDTHMKHKQRTRLFKMSLEVAGNQAAGDVATYDIITQETAAAFSAPWEYGWNSIDLTRDLYTGPTTPGVAVACCHAVSNRGDVNAKGHVTYPDSNNNAADSTKTMTGFEGFGGYGGYALFAHQDRINQLSRTVNFGVGPNMEVPTDIIMGCAVNDVTTLGYGLSNFVAENPGLMGAWCSMNASEMFFVKQQNGGFVCRGDIYFPTVVRLPSLPPTFDAVNLATVAHNGMVIYGSRLGVYGWAGGDTAQAMSKQLSGYFWEVPGARFFNHTKGAFKAFHGYVAAPNNFLLDVDGGGWWRLGVSPDDDNEQPVYTWYDTSAAGYLIATPAFVTDEMNKLATYYDFEQGASRYSWRSQPLRTTQGRSARYREVGVVLSGTGTVVVRLTGIDGETDEVSFFVASPDPIAIDTGISVHTYDVVVDIIASATDEEGELDATSPAPRVYRVALGRDPLGPTARSAAV